MHTKSMNTISLGEEHRDFSLEPSPGDKVTIINFVVL